MSTTATTPGSSSTEGSLLPPIDATAAFSSSDRAAGDWRAGGTADPGASTANPRGYVFTAQWDQLMVGIRTGFTLRFLGERFLADTLSYSFVAYLRADVQVAQPAAFVVDTGVRA